MGFSVWAVGVVFCLGIGECSGGKCVLLPQRQAKDATPVNGQPGGHGDADGTVRGQLPDDGAPQSADDRILGATVRGDDDPRDFERADRAAAAEPVQGCGTVRGLFGRLRDRPRLIGAVLRDRPLRTFLGRAWTLLRDRSLRRDYSAGRLGRFSGGFSSVHGGSGLFSRRIFSSGRVGTLGPTHRPLLERWTIRSWTRARFYSRRPR